MQFGTTLAVFLGFSYLWSLQGLFGSTQGLQICMKVVYKIVRIVIYNIPMWLINVSNVLHEPLADRVRQRRPRRPDAGAHEHRGDRAAVSDEQCLLCGSEQWHIFIPCCSEQWLIFTVLQWAMTNIYRAAVSSDKYLFIPCCSEKWQIFIQQNTAEYIN